MDNVNQVMIISSQLKDHDDHHRMQLQPIHPSMHIVHMGM